MDLWCTFHRDELRDTPAKAVAANLLDAESFHDVRYVSVLGTDVRYLRIEVDRELRACATSSVSIHRAPDVSGDVNPLSGVIRLARAARGRVYCGCAPSD